MAEPISREEHEEFAKRMEEEHHRQNKRIDLLEASNKELTALAGSVQKLAVNMENMLIVQKQQGDRLEELEGRDGEMWRKAVGYVLTAIIGIAIGFVFRQIGM